jgi:hypothetical protein
VGWVRAAGVATCVVVVCGCSSSDDHTARTSATRTAGQPFTSASTPAASSFDPHSADCEAGAPACVDATVAEMTTRLDPLLQSCDHNSVFALTYLRTTEEFRRTIDDPSSFSDVGYMIREDALFASFYFDAYDAWKAGRSADVPQAWKIASCARQ